MVTRCFVSIYLLKGCRTLKPIENKQNRKLSPCYCYSNGLVLKLNK